MFANPVGFIIESTARGTVMVSQAERLRLEAVRRSRAADPGLRAGLDRIAACAATSLSAPLGAVSLVGETDILLAGMHGFDRRRTPRAGSLCEAVVDGRTALVITNLAGDVRFREHEFVAEGGVQCYAGAPIFHDGGDVLGAVCVFAADPDAFTSADLSDLEALAHMAGFMVAGNGPRQAELPRVLQQGWIGVRTLDASRTGAAARAGLVVLSVAKGSPAERAGLRPTDILYSVDGRLLRERADLVAALAGRELGSSAEVMFQRAGQWMQRRVTVAGRRSRHAVSAV